MSLLCIRRQLNWSLNVLLQNQVNGNENLLKNDKKVINLLVSGNTNQVHRMLWIESVRTPRFSIPKLFSVSLHEYTDWWSFYLVRFWVKVNNIVTYVRDILMIIVVYRSMLKESSSDFACKQTQNEQLKYLIYWKNPHFQIYWLQIVMFNTERYWFELLI